MRPRRFTFALSVTDHAKPMGMGYLSIGPCFGLPALGPAILTTPQSQRVEEVEVSAFETFAMLTHPLMYGTRAGIRLRGYQLPLEVGSLIVGMGANDEEE